MGPQQKKTPRGGVFFFLLRPRADAHSLTAGLGGASPSPGWCFFFCCGPARTGVVFFFAVAPPRRSLTHCGLGRFRQGSGGVFFFLLWPRPVFLGNSKKCLVYYIGSKKTRRATTKKNTTGRCFFFCCGPARTLTHSLRAWVVPPPRRGGVFFFCCGPARTGVVFFFLLWPRPDAHSLTVGWGDFGKVRVVFFFFCCGPAGSFLVSLKRPGGAAAKKTPRGGVFFFAAAPRGRSLTHCGPGWCLPLAGVFFFFCCGPARTGVVFFFFAVAPPRRSLTHCGLGRFRQGSGGVFFFAVAPPGLFRQ